jgi:hypothetical protein
LRLVSQTRWRRAVSDLALIVCIPPIIIVCFFVAAWIVATDKIGR